MYYSHLFKIGNRYLYTVSGFSAYNIFGRLYMYHWMQLEKQRAVVWRRDAEKEQCYIIHVAGFTVCRIGSQVDWFNTFTVARQQYQASWWWGEVTL